MIEKEFLRIAQREFTMYSVVLSVEDLLNCTVVEYYNSQREISPGYKGYQRPLVMSHVRKIARYLQASETPLLPTSLLMAVNPEHIQENGRILHILDKLRVVDGQHRIEGIRYLQKVDEVAFKRVSMFGFPSVVMVLGPEERVHEISAFININKAGKKVHTNLAVELRDQINGNDIAKIQQNVRETVSTRVSHMLSDSRGGVWYKKIQLGDVSTQGGIISIQMFQQSLLPVVDVYLSCSDDRDVQSLEDVNDIINDLTVLVRRAWEAIADRWEECFPPYKTVHDKFNIQKGIGVVPLHAVLGDALKAVDGDTDDAIRTFTEIIETSDINWSDWKIGGALSTFNTKAGFKHVVDMIRRKRNIIRE